MNTTIDGFPEDVIVSRCLVCILTATTFITVNRDNINVLVPLYLKIIKSIHDGTKGNTPWGY